MSVEELERVSGGIWGNSDDAPDGHEFDCDLSYYDYSYQAEYNYWCSKMHWCQGMNYRRNGR